VRSPLFGHFVISMPFVSYGGPLGSPAAIEALSTVVEARARRERVDLLEFRSARPLSIAMPVSHRKITVVLSLVPGDAEAVFKGFKAKLRSQIRRPAKEGVEVKMGADQVSHFHAVFARHMRDLGTPTMPLSWFRELPQVFGDDVWFAVAWKDGVPIAAGAGFRWDGEFEITWASALREYNSFSPNMAVYWALIERAAKEGLSRFNFGRCTEGSPTHRFKQQWGALDEPLYWYGSGARGETAMPKQSSGKFALASRVWTRLPLSIANRLGPMIVRYIP
jgi:FemAB-related protein (PEP-CTERM system-associated)